MLPQGDCLRRLIPVLTKLSCKYGAYDATDVVLKRLLAIGWFNPHNKLLIRV